MLFKLSEKTQVTLTSEPAEIILTLHYSNRCGYNSCIEMVQFGTLKAHNDPCSLQLGCQNGSSLPTGRMVLTYKNFLHITTGCNAYDRRSLGTFDMRNLLHKGHNIIEFSNGCDNTVGTLSVTYKEQPHNNNEDILLLIGGIIAIYALTKIGRK